MTIILGGPVLIVEPILICRLPEVKRTQQILIFLISVVLIIYCISFLTVIYSLSTKSRTNIYELILILFWILCFASGMFITERYDHHGLLVFAWFGIINIIITCSIIVIETVGIVINTSELSRGMSLIRITGIPLYTYLIGIILHAIIIILAFKLSYLIEENKKLMDHQQI